MGRWRGKKGRLGEAFGALFNAGGDTEDYEVEADDGYDLVEHIRTAKHFGRDAFLETDVDFYG